MGLPGIQLDARRSGGFPLSPRHGTTSWQLHRPGHCHAFQDVSKSVVQAAADVVGGFISGHDRGSRPQAGKHDLSVPKDAGSSIHAWAFAIVVKTLVCFTAAQEAQLTGFRFTTPS